MRIILSFIFLIVVFWAIRFIICKKRSESLLKKYNIPQTEWDYMICEMSGMRNEEKEKFIEMTLRAGKRITQDEFYQEYFKKKSNKIND